jgi:hypothetical protein
MNTLNFNRRVNTQIRKIGYGRWEVTMPVYGKPFTMHTTNSSAIDDFDDDNDRRIASGYKAPRRELMNVYGTTR